MLKRNSDDSPEMEVGKLGPSDYFGELSCQHALALYISRMLGVGSSK